MRTHSSAGRSWCKWLLLTIVISVLAFSGCDNRFRLAPKKGRPHPHHAPEDTYNRTWVYKHEKGTPSPFSDEELAYRAKRAELAQRLAVLYKTSAESFAVTMFKMKITRPQPSAAIFNDFLYGWFQSVQRKGYVISTTVLSDSGIPAHVQSYLTRISASTGPLKPEITEHLHYGDDAKDTEMYYEVFNGMFPIYQGETVCRIFRIDVLRFGKPRVGKEDAKVETDKILSLFAAEDPSSEQAWSSEDPTDDIDAIEADVTDIAGFEDEYPDNLKALFNFLWNSANDPLGIRFEEILLSNTSQENERNQRSGIYTMVLLKNSAGVSEIISSKDKEL